MNNFVSLELQKDQNGELILSWNFVKEEMSNFRRIKFEFLSKIDEDEFAKIRDEFYGFPAWW